MSAAKTANNCHGSAEKKIKENSDEVPSELLVSVTPLTNLIQSDLSDADKIVAIKNIISEQSVSGVGSVMERSSGKFQDELVTKLEKQNKQLREENRRLRADLAQSGICLSVDDGQTDDSVNSKLGEQNIEDIMDGPGRVFVRGISKQTSELDIQAEFERFGPVVDTYNTGDGYAFVTYQNKVDAVRATENMTSKIIKVETARKGLVDLPAEIINIISECLPFKDRKTFREVCLMDPLLRSLYKDEILESGKLCINLQTMFLNDNVDFCRKFFSDFDVLINSKIDISLRIDDFIDDEGLENKVIQMINECYPRITEMFVSCNTPRNVMALTPKLKHLKKLLVDNYDEYGMSNDIFLERCKILIRNNADLEELSLSYIDIDAATSSSCNNLKDLSLAFCHGHMSLMINQSARNLKRLYLFMLSLDSEITEPLSKLETLDLYECRRRGNLSSLLTSAAPSIKCLELTDTPLEIHVGKPFNNLKHVSIDNVKLDISESPLFARPGELRELHQDYKGFNYESDDSD